MVTRPRSFRTLAAACVIAGGTMYAGVGTTHAGAPSAGSGAFSKFCSRLHTSSQTSGTIEASSGAQMLCFGPQSGSGSGQPSTPTKSGGTTPKNVDAARPSEDISPAGAQAYGQSEVSVAAVGNAVVEAWNDATSFFSPCPSPNYKEEGTGLGFSTNGGASFTDLGGLPNDCTTGNFFGGDPSVEAWQPGGTPWFYVASLYRNVLSGNSYIAFDACKGGPTLSCGSPVIAASGDPSNFDFLDKDFLSIDPVHGRLYVSYTRFGSAPNDLNGQIELAVCDIGTSTGGTGSGGGTASAPVCFPGTSTTPYLVITPGDPNCENEGAYPAVDVATGDVYVAHEYNWATNIFNPACEGASTPTQEVISHVPFACLRLGAASCTRPDVSNAVSINSMAAAFIPGYNRFPMNDFPRIAVSDAHGSVSIVWNDTRANTGGDIFLQSFHLGTLTGISPSPVRIDSGGSQHFLPSLRNADNDGGLEIGWYQRGSGTTANTDYYVARDVNPVSTSTPARSKVTSVASNWLGANSDIVPNFGDYTDIYVQATPSSPYTTERINIAWTDGRSGDPQPYYATLASD
jgi:hypothetical protein